ncbi:MAG: Crp/Fnr family transcriptional regulator [Chitinophagales bacterium]|jgi:CRP-like cAMP-binding protein|nr:Crp/Fnr family transcriptional regulator [Chitinophagales bacterium]
MKYDYPTIARKLNQCWPDFIFNQSNLEACIESETVAAGDFFPKFETTEFQGAIVISGVFRLYYIAQNKEVNIQFLFENDLLIDLNNHTQVNNHHFRLQAIEQTELMVIDVTKLFERRGELFIQSGIDRFITQTLIQITTEHLTTNLYLSGEARYSKLFEAKPEYFVRLPLYHIASYLGMEKESLSRIRRTIIEKRKKIRAA